MSVKRSEGHEPDFDIDLKYGAEGEETVRELFAALEAGHKMIEVKRDRQTLATGNLYIECMQKPRGHSEYKPSGVATSKADVWAFVLGRCILIAPTDAVLWLARHHHEELRDGGMSGDCPTKGILIKLHKFIKEVDESPFSTDNPLEK